MTVLTYDAAGRDMGTGVRLENEVASKNGHPCRAPLRGHDSNEAGGL